VKTIFLLYLALPQTRGSSYLYTHHLQPFFHAHESQIDATLASLKARVYTFVQERLRAIWDNIVAIMGQQQQQQQQQLQRQQQEQQQQTAPNPPTVREAYSPAQLASNLWRSYGPSIIAAGTALLNQTSTTTTTPATTRSETLFNFPAAAPPAPVRTSQPPSVLERKRQLEAELAALSAMVPDNVNVTEIPHSPGPMPGAAFTSSRASSESDMRERRVSGGRFEEIEVPSDVEGYYAGGNENVSGSDGGSKRPRAGQRTSWFGWGSRDGYEAVKTE
jgi:receptor expression-enhancing protein 1/2/3/4